MLGPVLVSASLLTESSLPFLGLSDPNVVSWGGMVGAGREVLRTDWYVAALPGLAIVAVVFGLNLLGDALADALDPRRTRRGWIPSSTSTACPSHFRHQAKDLAKI